MRERGRPSDRPAPVGARRRIPDDPLFTTAYVPPPLQEKPALASPAGQAAIVRRRRSPVPALLAAPPESA
jgi:hypothetical protein